MASLAGKESDNQRWTSLSAAPRQALID